MGLYEILRDRLDSPAFNLESNTHDDRATGLVVLIPQTWTGLHDTLVDRSNARSVVRDYEWVSTHSRGPYSQWVCWNAEEDWENETAETFHGRLEEVVELIGALVDYPIYDESDHSELEWEDTEEQWRDWAGKCETCGDVLPMVDDVDGMGITHDGDSIHVSDEYRAACEAKHAPHCAGE